MRLEGALGEPGTGHPALWEQHTHLREELLLRLLQGRSGRGQLLLLPQLVPVCSGLSTCSLISFELSTSNVSESSSLASMSRGRSPSAKQAGGSRGRP